MAYFAKVLAAKFYDFLPFNQETISSSFSCNVSGNWVLNELSLRRMYFKRIAYLKPSRCKMLLRVRPVISGKPGMSLTLSRMASIVMYFRSASMSIGRSFMSWWTRLRSSPLQEADNWSNIEGCARFGSLFSVNEPVLLTSVMMLLTVPDPTPNNSWTSEQISSLVHVGCFLFKEVQQLRTICFSWLQKKYSLTNFQEKVFELTTYMLYGRPIGWGWKWSPESAFLIRSFSLLVMHPLRDWWKTSPSPDLKVLLHTSQSLRKISNHFNFSIGRTAVLRHLLLIWEDSQILGLDLMMIRHD